MPFVITDGVGFATEGPTEGVHLTLLPEGAKRFEKAGDALAFLRKHRLEKTDHGPCRVVDVQTAERQAQHTRTPDRTYRVVVQYLDPSGSLSEILYIPTDLRGEKYGVVQVKAGVELRPSDPQAAALRAWVLEALTPQKPEDVDNDGLVVGARVEVIH